MSELKFDKVTHVIFDMDGLLLNTEERYDSAFKEMCHRYGVEYTLKLRQDSKGRSSLDKSKMIISTFNLPVTVEEFDRELGEINKSKFAQYVEFMPGAERLVNHLKKNNIPISIATGSRAKTFEMKAKYHATFFSLFDHIIKGSDPELKRGKPAPDIFLLAASRFQESPAQMKNCLVFEDARNGVKAAIAAGMQVVWVPANCYDMVEISGDEATVTIPSLELFQPELFGLPPFQE